MNWILIISLSLFGVMVGMLSIFGVTEGKEYWMLGIVLLVSSLVLGMKAPGKFFKHGFFTALISALLSSVLHYVFYDTYMANNASFAEQMSQVPDGFNMRIMMLVGGPFSGAISGVILGGLTILMARLLGNTGTTSHSLAETTEAPSSITNGD